MAALRVHDGNRTPTARALGIGRATLLRKLAQYQSAGPENCGSDL